MTASIFPWRRTEALLRVVLDNQVRLGRRVDRITQQQEAIMTALQDLQAANARLGTSISSAITKLNSDTTNLADMAAKLAASQPSDDSAALAALAADISSKADALDTAAGTNATPAASAPAATVSSPGAPVTSTAPADATTAAPAVSVADAPVAAGGAVPGGSAPGV